MKNILKLKFFPNGGKNMINMLTTWGLLLFAILTVCLISGCRLFTVGG